MTKTDLQMKQGIEDELDPETEPAQVGVGVDHGVVSMLEHAGLQVAVAVKRALEEHLVIPRTVTAKVQAGSITLEGHVRWDHQRTAAERAVRSLTGVIAVFNCIALERRAVVGRTLGRSKAPRPVNKK